ncbi:MAG: TIGR04255 family protein [Chloroflexota bacterium]|jgi:uncharacterized protein (TIGR04255 family)
MAERRKLQHPPLVEALLEVRWELDEIAPGVFRDPGFSVAHVRFYEQVKSEFPFIEPLPTLQVPDELTAHLAKYRYRVAQGQWPLVQIGPGVATLNFTEPYDWESFLSHARRLFPALVSAYDGYEMQFSSLMLRYINAEPFDYEKDDLVSFLRTHLNTEFQTPVEKRFLELRQRVRQVSWSAQYELSKPSGTGILRFATGKNPQGNRTVIWEQVVESTGAQMPASNREDFTMIIHWLDEAHAVVEDWFLCVVEGRLLSKYQGGEG